MSCVDSVAVDWGRGGKISLCMQARQALARAARGPEFDLWIDTLKRLGEKSATSSRVLRRWLGGAAERLPNLVALHLRRQTSVVL